MSESMRRRSFAAGIAGCLAAAFILGGAPGALAASGPFVIDGNIPDSGTQNLPDTFGSVKELGPLNSNTTKIGVIHNDAVPTLDLTNPNAQVDLRQGWVDLERQAGKDWAYFAWERDSNNGSGFIAFEFMQNPLDGACGDYSGANVASTCNPWKNRTANDFIIMWDQQGNSRDLYIRKWSGTAPNLVLSDPELIPLAFGEAQYGENGFKGEAAVNVTDVVFGGSTACRTFANIIPSTVTGNSDTADYKDTILRAIQPIGNCTSTTTTTPKTAAGASIPGTGIPITQQGYVAVKDTAVIAIQGGAAPAAGSVSFFLCKVEGSALCATGGTPLGTRTLSGSYPATVESDTAYVTSAGNYCFRADYTGNTAAGIGGSSDATAGECFQVNPVTPTLTTTAGADAVLGNPVTDTATLTGTALQPMNPVIQTVQPSTTVPPRTNAGGKITFTLYTKTATSCVAVAGSATEVTVNGDSSQTNVYSVSFTPTAAGTYQWGAVYSDSTTNTNGASHNSGTCNVSAEEVVVNTVPSTMTTAQRWVPNDSATIKAAAGGNLAGNARFTLYNSSDCTGTIVYGPVDVPVSGPGTVNGTTVSTSNSTAVTASGSYSWLVSYDSTNPAQDDIAASCKEVSSLTINNNFVQP